jgi:hypothetical protein
MNEWCGFTGCGETRDRVGKTYLRLKARTLQKDEFFPNLLENVAVLIRSGNGGFAR